MNAETAEQLELIHSSLSVQAEQLQSMLAAGDHPQYCGCFLCAARDFTQDAVKMINGQDKEWDRRA